MKKHAKRLTALALALVLAVGAMGQTALASWALGKELTERTVTLAEGVTYTSQSLWSASKSDLRTEHYVTYIPGGAAKPVVYSGTYVASINTVAAAADRLKAQGYRVAAAINGGFFNSDGTIVGMLMTDGVVRALDVYNNTLLGFTKDGKVFIDESRITKTVSWETEGVSSQYDLMGFNAYRSNDALGGLYLYNQDFGSRVNKDSRRDCVSVLLHPVSGESMTMNRSLVFEVVSVADTGEEDTFNGVLNDGNYMLYANYVDGNDDLLNGLRTLVPGQQVTVSVGGVSEQWNDAAYGISGMYSLLRDGEIVSGLPASANPYTAVGVKKDGTAVFYTIDGRQSGYSVGATYAQVAERLQELGCVTAVALDGGGSTTLGATLPGSSNFTILNRPSTSGRPVNNTILLVTPDSGPTGVYAGAYVNAPNKVVLVNAELPVTATFYDTAGYLVTDRVPVWTSDGGLFRETSNGTVFYCILPGTFRISADRDGKGGALTVQVVDTLSSLRVSREDTSGAVTSLSLKPGDTVELTASGTWLNLPVAMDDGDVTWKADKSIGTIDANGHFRAVEGHQNASGNITATAGGKTVTIRVTVQASHPFTDIANHWSADYVGRLYELGITDGDIQPDGTVVFRPGDKLTRGELFAFIARMLHADTGKYQNVTLPFEDAESIDGSLLPYVKAMYALGVMNGSGRGGKLYADVDISISREETMTILGRVLADQGVSGDLSGFADSGLVSDWARPYMEMLVGLNVVQGSGGKLSPKSDITRGEGAKLLVEISGMEKAALTQRQPD